MYTAVLLPLSKYTPGTSLRLQLTMSQRFVVKALSTLEYLRRDT